VAFTKWGDQSIEYVEVEIGDGQPAGSPMIRTDHKGTSVTRVYDVDFGDLGDAVKQFVGRTEFTLTGTGGIGDLHRVRPHAFDHGEGSLDPDGNPYVFAQRVSRVEFRGWNDASARQVQFPSSQGFAGILIPQFDKARLTVEYESLDFDILTDDQVEPTVSEQVSREFLRYTAKSMDVGGELIQLPTGGFKWTDWKPDQDPKDQNVSFGYARSLPFGHPVYRWLTVPGIPPAADKYFGCVNNDTFDTFFEEGTLLLTQVETQLVYPPWNFRQTGPATAFDWYDIIYHFRWDPNKHNFKLRRSDDDTYAFNELNTSGKPLATKGFPYAKVDFAYLFSFATPPDPT
jgi:hypothetical protein